MLQLRRRLQQPPLPKECCPSCVAVISVTSTGLSVLVEQSASCCCFRWSCCCLHWFLVLANNMKQIVVLVYCTRGLLCASAVEVDLIAGPGRTASITWTHHKNQNRNQSLKSYHLIQITLYYFLKSYHLTLKAISLCYLSFKSYHFTLPIKIVSARAWRGQLGPDIGLALAWTGAWSQLLAPGRGPGLGAA